MKVVLDCRSVFEGAGGIGRSTAELARELPRHLGPDDSLVLLVGARRPPEPLTSDPRVHVAATDATMIDPVFEQVHLPALLRQLEADVVHTTCFTTPIAADRVARVSTVHDVVFRRHPELVDPALCAYLDHWTGVTCRLADAVVTVSGFSREEIAACYGLDRERIDVVPNGVSPRFFELGQRRQTSEAPFLLYVGSLEAKKNVSALLRAFRRLLELDPTLPHHLVLAGGSGGQAFDPEAALAAAGPARARVRLLGHVPEPQLDQLYAQADAFLYLSRYEGFGLPPLEAMAAGVPTLVSNRSSLPEVVGDGALIVDPSRPRQVARALLDVLRDPARRTELAYRGQTRARAFTWPEAARRLMTAYRRAVERRDRRLTLSAASLEAASALTATTPLELLHLASEYNGKVYGLGRFVHGLARAQAARGHRVHVLTNSAGGAEDDVVLDGVHVHRIAFPNPPCPADGHGEVLQWNHGVVSRVLDRVERFRSVGLVLAHDWLTAIAAREVAALLGKPLVVTFHDEVIGKHQGVLDDQARFVRDLEALTAHDANHLIANSRYVARQLVRHYGVPEDKITAIPGGIDPRLLDVAAPSEVAAFRRALVEDGEDLVLYVGRLDPEKGLGTLARAWAQVRASCPRARLVIAGAGRLEARLREQVGDSARFLGYVERDALGYLYRAADVAVVPSIYEPFGLVAVEGMLAGRAVVTSSAGGLAEIVRDGEDGLRVPPADPDALAEALVTLLRDPPRREQLGVAARGRVLRDFTWGEIARRTDGAYAQALGATPRILEVAPSLPPAPLVSLVLVTRDAPVDACAALRSLERRTSYRPLEVLIADESEGAGARAALQREAERLRGHGLSVATYPAEAAAVAAARGELLLRMTQEVEVPEGSEHWLSGLVWLLEEAGAASVSPTLLDRTEIAREGARIPDPRREQTPEPACVLVRRRDLPGVLAQDRPGEHWRHGVALLRSRGGADLAASVVVVAYKQRELTREAIEAVLHHTAPPFELVLVDNGSGDGTRELLRGYEAALGGAVPVQVIENEANLGYPVGANQGARAARGRHVVLLNNDTRVRPGWLAALLEAAESSERVGAVTAKILDLDGAVQSAGGILHEPEGRGFEIPFQGEDRLAPPVTARREVENAGGPCLLLTRGLLEAFPEPFDPAYSPGYFEDSDLCLRARSQGWTLLYEPRAEVFHHGKATADLVAREGRTDVWAQFERNRERFLGRWRPTLEADHAARQRQQRAPAERARILLCYGKSATTTAVYLERALRREHDVITAGPGQQLDLGPVSARALVEAAGGQIDLLLVVEGENYVPDALEDAPCPTAAWLIDTHLHARRPGGWHFDLARQVDHVLIAQRDDLPRFVEAGVSAAWLPLACDPEVHAQPTPPSGRDLDVVFVGHLLPIHARRRHLLELLARRFRVNVAEGVYLADMARLFARAKVVWNCSLAGDMNMRVFEGLASGGLVVTDRIEAGLTELFAPGEHLLVYDDESSLVQTIERALTDEQTRAEIARRGQRLALRHHTYAHRARLLVERTLGPAAATAKRPRPDGKGRLRLLAGGRA